MRSVLRFWPVTSSETSHQIWRLLLVVADDDHARAQEAQSVMRGANRLLLDDLRMPRFQHLADARDELIGFLLGENVMIGLADDGSARAPRNRPALGITKVARGPEEDDGRKVVDEGLAKLPGAEQRAQIVAGFRRCIVRNRPLCHFVLVETDSPTDIHYFASVFAVFRIQGGTGHRCDGRGGGRGPSHRVPKEERSRGTRARTACRHGV